MGRNGGCCVFVVDRLELPARNGLRWTGRRSHALGLDGALRIGAKRSLPAKALAGPQREATGGKIRLLIARGG